MNFESFLHYKYGLETIPSERIKFQRAVDFLYWVKEAEIDKEHIPHYASCFSDFANVFQELRFDLGTPISIIKVEKAVYGLYGFSDEEFAIQQSEDGKFYPWKFLNKSEWKQLEKMTRV